MRTPVSYKCGWGSDNKKLTPSLTLPAGEGTRADARLVHIPHPLKTTSLRGNIHSARSNPAGISNNMDCRVAPAPRNDIQLTHTPRPFGESGFADAGEGLNIILTITHPNLPSYREGTRCRRSIHVFSSPDNRVYLPSWGGRSCANASELQMRAGFSQS